jgi:hypothetical protein
METLQSFRFKIYIYRFILCIRLSLCLPILLQIHQLFGLTFSVSNMLELKAIVGISNGFFL